MKIKRRFLLWLILPFLAVMSSTVSATNLPGSPNGWTDGFVYVNGIRIHYYQAVPAPEKPIMVMVHGVTDNALCWTTLAQRLQDSYNIYMLDTRAHGLSDPFTTLDNDETLIKDVVGFVKEMNLEKPILVGHSMGAATVMRLGAEYPELAQTIIMLDPFLMPLNMNRPKPKNDKPKETPEKVSKEINSVAKSKPKTLSLAMFGNPEKLVMQNNYSFDDLVNKGLKSHPKWDELDVKYWALSKKQYHGPFTDEAWKAMHGVMKTGNSLERITVKSLILKADNSPEGRKANNEAVKGLERVKLVHIDGAGHNPHHDELEQTLTEIKGFLSE